MNHTTHNSIVNFIWGVADDVLRDVYVRGHYRNVILPMTVIRRLGAVLEPTKQTVLGMKQQLDAAGIANQPDRKVPGRPHQSRPQTGSGRGRQRAAPGAR